MVSMVSHYFVLGILVPYLCPFILDRWQPTVYAPLITSGTTDREIIVVMRIHLECDWPRKSNVDSYSLFAWPTNQSYNLSEVMLLKQLLIIGSVNGKHRTNVFFSDEPRVMSREFRNATDYIHSCRHRLVN